MLWKEGKWMDEYIMCDFYLMNVVIVENCNRCCVLQAREWIDQVEWNPIGIGSARNSACKDL